MSEFEVVVLGAGPGGYGSAIRCAQLGLKTAIVESREFGGTCLNRGCIPTKALLQSAESYENALDAGTFGVNVQQVSFDYRKFSERKDAIVNRMNRSVEKMVKSYGITVYKGFGRLADRNTIRIKGNPEEEITARQIILATGSEPACLPIPGSQSPLVLDSDDVLASEHCHDSYVVIGGGVIGVEFASLFSSLGKEVTILELLPEILPQMDQELRQILMQLLRRKGVQFRTSVRVERIETDEAAKTVTVHFSDGKEPHAVAAAACILCVGRKPVTEDIGLESAGIRTENGFVSIDAECRTNVPHIYAIGDMTGKVQLAHVATSQGLVAAANCAGQHKRMRYDRVPSCVYTHPEWASVGLSEKEAEQAGYSVKCGRYNLAGNGKAVTMEAIRGMVKLVIDNRTQAILGAQILAPRATDMIAEIVVAMQAEATLNELADSIHPHPTISETIMEAAHDVESLSVNSMPKKK